MEKQATASGFFAVLPYLCTCNYCLCTYLTVWFHAPTVERAEPYACVSFHAERTLAYCSTFGWRGTWRSAWNSGTWNIRMRRRLTAHRPDER